jgi:hypothetical protein
MPANSYQLAANNEQREEKIQEPRGDGYHLATTEPPPLSTALLAKGEQLRKEQRDRELAELARVSLAKA